MAKYLETAKQLQKMVDNFLELYRLEDVKTPTLDEHANKMMAVDLGHIINMAVRCNPRQSQGTVRKNIVATAMKEWCDVTMTKEMTEDGERTYNLIHITKKQ